MALPTNIIDGQADHAAIHNATNAEVNRVAALLGSGLPGSSLGTANLDTITTAGVYYQDAGANATLAANYPVGGVGGILDVRTRGAANLVIQHFVPMSSTYRITYYRRNVSGTWTAWRATSSQRIDQTAGRALYTWDDVNNREWLIYGDTGVRDITALFPAGEFSAGAIYLARQGRMVSLDIQGITFAANPTAEHTYTDIIPAGFRTGLTRRVAISTSATTIGTVLFLTNGDIKITTGVAGTAYSVASYPVGHAEVWPTTLPGTAFGAIPSL